MDANCRSSVALSSSVSSSPPCPSSTFEMGCFVYFCVLSRVLGLSGFGLGLWGVLEIWGFAYVGRFDGSPSICCAGGNDSVDREELDEEKWRLRERRLNTEEPLTVRQLRSRQ